MKMQKSLVSWSVALLLAGCSLQPQKMEDTHLFLLDARPVNEVSLPRRDLVLAISQPVAWPGFDTPQIVYLRQPLNLDYFATHRWADTPPRMLKPQLVRALEAYFRSVVSMPTILPASLRLDTEIVRLQQDFMVRPSRIQLTVRAQLIDVKNKRIIATKLFDESENAGSDDAYGGVLAANRALQRILQQLAEFCFNASAHLQQE